MAQNARTRVIRLEQRGRGRALKQAWSTSTADVVAYMDVDLSTGLESLRPLIDPIVEGQCEVSIGSRLAPGAEIARSVQRELISRGYNTDRPLLPPLRRGGCSMRLQGGSLEPCPGPHFQDRGQRVVLRH